MLERSLSPSGWDSASCGRVLLSVPILRSVERNAFVRRDKMPTASQPRLLDLDSSISAQDVENLAKTRLSMDEASFRLFYERSAPKLFAYLLRVSGERSLAEDLLQEAYCRFLSSKLPEMKLDASQRSYLFRIATNLMHDHWRRNREDPMPEMLPEPTSGQPRIRPPT